MTNQSSLAINRMPTAVIREQNSIVFHRVYSRGQLSKAWAALTGRPAHPLELAQALRGKVVSTRRTVGVRTVRINQIKGSESRSQDFDRSFRPLRAYSKQRWLSVAMACSLGIGLPAVELIQVGADYFVRDGHHRVSVARALGYEYIEAHVTEYRLA